MTGEDRQYNLRFLKKSRLKQGDIFAMLLNDGEYLFGRVVRDNLSFEESPFGGSSLIYIYNVRSESKSVGSVELSPDRLLIPPMFVGNILWSKGFATKVANLEISKKDLLDNHCFYSPTNKQYFDEKGNKISRRTEPCGEWVYVSGLSYIDNKISDALGIKRAPLMEDDMWYMSGMGEKVWFKQSRSELQKYSNYEEVIKKYPEIIEQ